MHKSQQTRPLEACGMTLTQHVVMPGCGMCIRERIHLFLSCFLTYSESPLPFPLFPEKLTFFKVINGMNAMTDIVIILIIAFCNSLL